MNFDAFTDRSARTSGRSIGVNWSPTRWTNSPRSLATWRSRGTARSSSPRTDDPRADGTRPETRRRPRRRRRRRRSGRLDGDETPERVGNLLREEVIWAITLSEEDGRVTTFRNGTYQDYPRDQIGGRWRPEEDPRSSRESPGGRSCLVCPVSFALSRFVRSHLSALASAVTTTPVKRNVGRIDGRIRIVVGVAVAVLAFSSRPARRKRGRRLGGRVGRRRSGPDR